MKKILLSVVLLLVMLATVACGGGGKPTGSNKAFEVPEIGLDTSKQITLKFSNTMGQNLKGVFEQYKTEFEKLYPNIHIEVDNPGGYDDVRDQIKTALSTNEQPNFAYCYPDHVAMYNIAHAVTILDNLIDSKIEVKRADNTTEVLGLTQAQKDDFIQGYYDEGKQFGDGLMYSLPLSKSTEVLYYNVDEFKKLGLTVPDHWWCTESCTADCKTSMEYVCAAIKKAHPSSTPLGYDSESNWFITMCEQMKSPYTSATGEKFLFDNDTNKMFIKKFNDWYNKGYITTQSIYGSYTSGLFIKTDDQASYMSIGSSAGATHQRPTANEEGKYPFEVGITSIPQYDKNNKKVISQGPSICIFNKEDPQEVVASWLFVKYMATNVHFQSDFAQASGYVPVIKSVANDDDYKHYMSQANGGKYIAALSAKVCMEQEAYYFTSPAFNGSSVARDQVGLLLKNCISSDKKGAELDSFINNAFTEAINECKYRS